MRLFLFALAIAVALCPRAGATAFAGVEYAFWQADFAYYVDPQTESFLYDLPAGVSLTCTGTAQAHGTNGCMDSGGVSVVSNGPDLKTGIVDQTGGLELRNLAGADWLGVFVFRTEYSSFNPGGPEIGARVDGPSEYAAFFTVVDGPGVFDLHGCNMVQSGGASPLGLFPPHSCGVLAPDSSEGDAFLGPLLAGGVLSADYRIFIRVDAQGSAVPEWPTLAYVLSGAALLAMGLRRRRIGVRTDHRSHKSARFPG